MIAWIAMIVWSFFGWNSSQPERTNIPQYETSWFVEELINTWNDIDSWSIQSDTINTDTKDYIEIRVMMPKYFYNSGWKNFAQDLYSDKKIYMKFIFVDDLNIYRDKLSDLNFSEADLFLFPYDWHEKVSTRTFNPQQTLQSYFDELLTPITQTSQVWFLPFAADPMIMYAMTWYTSTNSFYEISEYVLDRNPVRPLSFPLFFGIDSQDFYDKWFKWEYQDIVRYALLHYFQINKDSRDLQTRIDSNALQKYNIHDLNMISNIISAPECKYFPSLCFQVYNYVWVRFWFLSDYDVIAQYLPNKKSKFSSIKKFNMPFYQLESPVRIRWRWIRSSLDNPKTINAIYLLYKQYMDNYKNYDLWKSTLSVFKNDEWIWLVNNQYIWSKWYILQSWWDYITTLKWINKFWELIEYQISAYEYLRS